MRGRVELTQSENNAENMQPFHRIVNRTGLGTSVDLPAMLLKLNNMSSHLREYVIPALLSDNYAAAKAIVHRFLSLE